MRVLGAPRGLGATAPSPSAAPEYVQAVEFPYYLYPRALWERELVWLRTLGVRTVEFSIPWNWHQVQPGEFDFTGRTSPRRDLAGFIRVLRKLGLRAWVRPLPPVPDWLDGGVPAPSERRAQRAWLKELEGLLATQTASHGGPIAYVEGGALAIDAAPAPAPVDDLRHRPRGAGPQPRCHGRPASHPVARRGGRALSGGLGPDAGALLRRGAVGLAGDERPATRALRRDGALLRNWSPLVGALRPVAMPRPAPRKLPATQERWTSTERRSS